VIGEPENIAVAKADVEHQCGRYALPIDPVAQRPRNAPIADADYYHIAAVFVLHDAPVFEPSVR
jgi:hypothetical protein